MVRNARVAAPALAVLLIVVTSSYAANVGKAIADAEGRKRAAENGLKQIKMKSPESSEQARSAYEEAAGKQNAWLDSVCGALEGAANVPPNVSGIAESAAKSLVQWVNVRNRALGLPELTGAIAESVQTSVVADLNEIAEATWKSNRSADPNKRKAAAMVLSGRLRWKPFDGIQ